MVVALRPARSRGKSHGVRCETVSTLGAHYRSVHDRASVRSMCTFCSRVQICLTESYGVRCALPVSSCARGAVSCGRLRGFVLTSAVGRLRRELLLPSPQPLVGVK